MYTAEIVYPRLSISVQWLWRFHLKEVFEEIHIHAVFIKWRCYFALQNIPRNLRGFSALFSINCETDISIPFVRSSILLRASDSSFSYRSARNSARSARPRNSFIISSDMAFELSEGSFSCGSCAPSVFPEIPPHSFGSPKTRISSAI